jgi:Uma2 family endonuclease
MSVITPPPQLNPPPMSPYPLRRFTVDEYHQLIQAGILTENDPVELLEGWIVPKMPHNPPHDGTIELVEEVLRNRLPTGWRIRIHSAITTADSEPEPDLAIVRGTARSYLNHHPDPPRYRRGSGGLRFHTGPGPQGQGPSLWPGRHRLLLDH